MYPFDNLHRGRERPLPLLIFLEAFLVTLIGTLIAWVIFSAAAGLISVFLITLGLQETFLLLLDVNRRDIWEKKLTGYAANTSLVASLVALFFGCFAGISAIAWLLSTDTLRLVFRSQFELSPLQGLDLTRIDFGTLEVLFVHNFWVFALSFLISVFYRAGGALLILCWNASVWALSYAYLSQATIALGIGSAASTIGAVVVGITPHLALEVVAYVLAALVGIFFAKGIEKYRVRDPRFRRVMFASLALLVAGIAILAIGAAVEGVWPAYWLARVLRA